MSLDAMVKICLPAIEAELQQVVAQACQPLTVEMHGMLAYHMGWEGEGAGPEARGKRIRPLMTLLCAAACGADWQAALPSAAAVELVHNFSLAHDDIQDQSPLRRGRHTLWTLWGVAQAINAGDALFTLAFMALTPLEQTVSPAAALRSQRLLQETCLALTQGQYLDISYEARGDLDLAAYWPMVGGKTAALLSAATQLGAIAAQAAPETCQAYADFGRVLGLAFQAQDDLLGIWGDATLTGKSTESDLVSGKKSLPVLYGLAQAGPFARRWAEGPITAGEVLAVSTLLEAEGARQYTQARADELTAQALDALERAHPLGEAGQALHDLAHRLLRRST
jgi:geranylgeranyl diphosphate synthase type I